MRSWYTVTPLHNVALVPGARFEFRAGVALCTLPDWIRRDSVVKELSSYHRQALAEATHGFVVEYEAAGLGSPDPSWTGPRPKSIQETKYELTALANLALWLSRPSPACFTLVFHCPEFGGQAIIQQVRDYSPLLCHPRDASAVLSSEDVDRAGMLHGLVARVPRDNAIWTAVRATWSALQMNVEEIRYLLFWIALEALFGPEDAREMTFRLSQRIALFLATGRASEAWGLFAAAKKAYGFRSKVAHGRWKANPQSEALMATTENLVRSSLVRLLQEVQLMTTFLGGDREAYLDDLVFSGRNQ